MILDELIHHHEGTSQFKPLKRGTSFEAWKYGEMKALGSRLAQGGRAGDAYTMYAGVEGTTHDEIHALFGHAQVCNCV